MDVKVPSIYTFSQFFIFKLDQKGDDQVYYLDLRRPKVCQWVSFKTNSALETFLDHFVGIFSYFLSSSWSRYVTVQKEKQEKKYYLIGNFLRDILPLISNYGCAKTVLRLKLIYNWDMVRNILQWVEIGSVGDFCFEKFILQ